MSALSIRGIEIAGLAAWPALQSVRDRSWVLRAANGYTKRSNSVQSLDPHDVEEAPERLSRAAQWFAARALPPLFRVTPLAGEKVVGALEKAGWTAFDHSHVLAMSMPGGAGEDLQARFLNPTSPEWLNVQQALQGYDERTLDGLRAVAGAITAPACGMVYHNPEGEIVASALMVVAEAIAIAGNVVTAQASRGRGHGRAMMLAGLAWALSQGARAAALNVQADNGPALRLYASLGYMHQYDYHYRTPGAR